ncbi:MAG: nucleotide-binding universal stress UspA family protein [Halobacteriales archaeon]|jgi:nucleotide-binding universal stress UspA family protein
MNPPTEDARKGAAQEDPGETSDAAAPDSPRDALEIDTVLVPVDGSEESIRAIEYGVAVADRYDADVHVLYVLGEDLVRAIEEEVIDQSAIAEDAQKFVEEATAMGSSAGVETTSSMAYGFTTQRISQHPGSVILDTAEEIDADFLVVPRETVSEEGSEVLEKAAEYVLSYASQPVLSV